MSARRTIALACAAAAAAVAVAVAGSQATPAPKPLPAVVLAVAGRPLPASTSVEFDLVLAVRERALQAYLRGLFTKGSAAYGHYLSAAAYGRRFGLSPVAMAALERRLRSLDLQVVASYPQMTSLRVRASAATLRRALGVVMRRYRGALGVFDAPEHPARVPAPLAPWVVAVAGLSTRPIAHTDALPSAAGGALRPVDVRSAYDLGPLYQAGVDGHGQTIAVMSIDGFSKTGFERYAKAVGLPSTAPEVVRLQTPQTPGDSETNLDTEIIHAIAPQAHIVDYQIQYNALADAVNEIVARHSATIVSGSFGACDTTGADPQQLQLDPGVRRDTEAALAAAASAGVTFVFSTGDAGAYDCSRADSNDHNLTTHFPSDAPYTLAVGGTVLSVANNESYAGETAWGDAASVQGGGGGVNPRDAAPSWESVATVSGVSNGHRQTPDVSAAGGSDSPWYTNDGSNNSADGWGAEYGTSAATPFWAASLLLVQQYMQTRGAGPLCFATPMLYGIAQASWQRPPFHDVTSGNNLYYQATQGWDFATGWGSPDVSALAGAAVTYRKQNPLPSGGCARTLTTSSSGGGSSSGPVAAVTTYWRDIAAGNYSGAYPVLAPGAVNLSESQFVAQHQQAGIEAIQFSGRAGSSSGSSATVDVSKLVTRSRQNGCQAWSGSYAMTNRGSWLIARADIAPQRC